MIAFFDASLDQHLRRLLIMEGLKVRDGHADDDFFKGWRCDD